jgi:hypothetical protein
LQWRLNKDLNYIPFLFPSFDLHFEVSSRALPAEIFSPTLDARTFFVPWLFFRHNATSADKEKDAKVEGIQAL